MLQSGLRQPSLLQAEQAQLSQPVLIRDILHALCLGDYFFPIPSLHFLLLIQ